VAGVNRERLQAIEDEYVSLESSLADPAVVGDHAQLRDLSRRYKDMTPVVHCARRLRAAEDDLATARELIEVADEGERKSLLAEVATLESAIDSAADELRMLLLPRDPNDGKAVIMEIRGAEGGEEANLFARDLFEMYRAFGARSGWSVEVLGADPSALGGFNQITFVVRGDTAWGRLKFEGGPHRVQRVPITESQGRIHTSSATVLVLPEAEEVEVAIDDKDLDIDVFRASGPGGQGVNTTDSAVRITHRPTGITVSMQDQRSQLQNKARAMQVLRARLLRLAQEQHDVQASTERRQQIGGGGRGEKIRTYNVKENRVTDHRIGFTIYKLADVLAGDLDDVIDALTTEERTRQLAGA
jgi:peptide chain release factor 1